MCPVDAPDYATLKRHTYISKSQFSVIISTMIGKS